MLFSYDFTNLSSAADVVAKLQARLRLAVETKREADLKLQGHGDTGEVEKLKIEAHILLLAEELDYVFEAIKFAQDKADGLAAQKSAVMLHASSAEISWRMIDRRDLLLAKLAVRDIDFKWLNRQDSSTVNNLAFGDLQAFDGAADAEWTEILSKYYEPANHPLVKASQICIFCYALLTYPPLRVSCSVWQSGQYCLLLEASPFTKASDCHYILCASKSTLASAAALWSTCGQRADDVPHIMTAASRQMSFTCRRQHLHHLSEVSVLCHRLASLLCRPSYRRHAARGRPTSGALPQTFRVRRVQIRLWCQG
jgi:hypothetical protein